MISNREFFNTNLVKAGKVIFSDFEAYSVVARDVNSSIVKIHGEYDLCFNSTLSLNL